MARYRIRPLTAEARARCTTRSPGSSPFRSSWSTTVEQLKHEASHLLRPGLGEFVVMIDVDESAIRLDGELRATARPESPAVAVSIESKHGSLLFVCDRFRHWQDNVRAIALGLEALRKVERYGIVQSDEQYRGWQALPPGTPMPPAQLTAEQAAARMCELSGMVDLDVAAADRVLGDPELAQRIYRAAARRCHPDVLSGSETKFQELDRCYRIVKAAAS